MSREDYEDWVRSCVIFWECSHNCPFQAFNPDDTRRCMFLFTKRCPYLNCGNCMQNFNGLCDKLDDLKGINFSVLQALSSANPEEARNRISNLNSLKASIVKCLNKKRYLTRIKGYDLFWCYIKSSYS